MFLEPTLRENEVTGDGLPTLARYLLGLIIAALSAALIVAVAQADKAAPDIAALAVAKLSLSGVDNPVTAVLLNFRSYDTLLEIAVLLIVAVALLPSRSATPILPAAGTRWLVTDYDTPVNPALVGLLKWLVPLAVVLGGYLLWTGAYRPGGAFQAGAVVAGAGVALSLAGRHRFIWVGRSAHFFLCLGLLVFVIAAAVSALVTGTTLQYPIPYAGGVILLVEVAATLSIAAILLLLFTCLQTMGLSFSARSSVEDSVETSVESPLENQVQ